MTNHSKPWDNGTYAGVIENGTLKLDMESKLALTKLNLRRVKCASSRSSRDS